MGKYRRILFTTMIVIISCLTMMQGAANAADPNQEGTQKSQFSTDLRFIFTQIAKATIPAVVHIEVTQQQVVPFSPFLEIPQSPFSDKPQAPKKFKRELKGLGTGILIDETGDILTNNHVVDEATNIKVILSNAKQYEARIVGKDPKTDLAVIKINPDSKLPFVTFGDSDKVEVGEWVVAIGHPRGLDQTVTAGIISAKHRQGITDPSSYQDFLQTDAAINPGNSGGPLINLKGEVIGINSVIASESGGSEGIGFAIPSNFAISISKTLIAYGKVKRGWIGVTIQELEPEKAKSLKMEAPRGALVVDVVKGGPADKAGLKKDDIVIKAGGKDVNDPGSLRNRVAATPIGTGIQVVVLRDGNEKNIELVVGDMDESLKYLSSIVKDRLGVEVRPVKTQESDNYGIDSGVVVKWLDPKGPMAEAGFEVGDVILEMDGQAIHSPEDFAGMVSVLQPDQDSVLLALDHRSGQSTYVQVKTH
ncbi:MAG: trypsin-like peptidase domain-containing protein [Desulfomonilia bacterium]